jgi:hypothetical protein
MYKPDLKEHQELSSQCTFKPNIRLSQLSHLKSLGLPPPEPEASSSRRIEGDPFYDP